MILDTHPEEIRIIMTDLNHMYDETPEAPRLMDISLMGRCMKADKTEFQCRVSEISASGATLSATTLPDMEERVIAYIDEIGRVEGIVTDVFNEGFYLQFIHSEQRHDKIAETLLWISERNSQGKIEDRAHPRYIPKDPKSRFTAPDGTTYPCEVIDMSISGASIAVKLFPRPIIGAQVYLGKMRGRVVRQHNRGVAIQFADVKETSTLADRFA